MGSFPLSPFRCAQEAGGFPSVTAIVVPIVVPEESYQEGRKGSRLGRRVAPISTPSPPTA